MHEVHALIRFVFPLMDALTLWMLGDQRLLERRWEWLIDLPNWGVLPQTSQI